MNNVVLTKANIFRNLKDYKFSHKLTQTQKDEIVETVKQIYVNKLPNLSINLFDGEHITINCFEDGYNMQAYTKASELASELSNKLNMAYSDEYGFLMSDLTKVGAGVMLSCDICLDAIKSINKIDQVKQNLRKLGYTLSETNLDSVYELSTTCNLGFSEKQIVENFESTVQKLQDLEVESAKMQDVENHDELKDKTDRSLAILNSAHLLRSDELNKHLVILRTALNLGLVDIDVEKINKLQRLSINSTKDIVSVSDLKDLAQKTKQILKGE